MSMASTRKKLRVGVIGAGAIAQECHLPGYARDARAQLVAFADPTRARHTEVQARFAATTGYTDYKQMLRDESLDVVSVCTPNAYHAAMTVAALEAGCHVLCEKPIATTLKEADRMIAAARSARRKLMIGFTHRLFSGPLQCKALLREKAIGKPFMIRVRFAHEGPMPDWAKSGWFYNRKLSAGGALLDMGIHAIDLCHWLIGPIESLNAQAGTLVKRIEVDDNALLQLQFRNGAYGSIEVGWTSKPGFSGFEIYGTKGTLLCDYERGLQVCEGTQRPDGTSDVRWRMLDKHPTRGGWTTEIGYWLDVLTGKERLTMTGRTGRQALEVALAAYQSSRNGRRVALR